MSQLSSMSIPCFGLITLTDGVDTGSAHAATPRHVPHLDFYLDALLRIIAHPATASKMWWHGWRHSRMAGHLRDSARARATL